MRLRRKPEDFYPLAADLPPLGTVRLTVFGNAVDGYHWNIHRVSIGSATDGRPAWYHEAGAEGPLSTEEEAEAAGRNALAQRVQRRETRVSREILIPPPNVLG